ncbi:MAG: aspartate aminotransferase family protein [Anaerolineales bacterium]|nr:aspartate aminotransferase family protein [Anaerolineales bacterium]
MATTNQEKYLFSTQALPKVAWAKGVYLYDTEGKQYFDASGGPAVFAIGHGNEEVNAAVTRQMAQFAHGYRYNFTSDPLEQLQEMIGRLCGGGLRHMLFVGSGSEAMESALKIALQYQQAIGQTKRTRFIARQQSYHGNSLGALSVSGYPKRRAMFAGSLLDVSFVSPANAYRPPEGLSVAEIADFCANELEQEILRLGAETVCAFVFEPIVGAAGGVVPAPPGYAQRMRAVCDRYGVVMIADEVMCGSGRSGTWRALGHDGVEPDIMTVAKGLGAGYIPLGAAIYHHKLAEPIFTAHGDLMTGHTFTGHSTACAAAVAVQQIVEREGLVAKVAREGEWLQATLRAELGDHPYVGDIRGRGFFIGVEFVADKGEKRPFSPTHQLAACIRAATLDAGLICYPVGGIIDGVHGDAAILAPPYNITQTEMEELVDRFVTAVRGVLQTVA